MGATCTDSRRWQQPDHRSPASCPGGRNGHQGLVASHSVRAAGQHLLVPNIPLIDQLFSRLAVYLRRNDATDREDFLRAFTASYVSKWGGRAKGFNLSTAANISDWLEGKVAFGEPSVCKLASMAQVGQTDGIAKFRQFMFRKQEGITIMQVRTRCGDDCVAWRGLNPATDFHRVSMLRKNINSRESERERERPVRTQHRARYGEKFLEFRI